MRRKIYDCAIIVLGAVQALPCFLLFSSTAIGIVLGIFHALVLGYFWSSTVIGAWFFRELWRSTLRLERAVLGDNG